MPATVDTSAYSRRFPVPDGFRALLEALAREVLRGQPSDIYDFSALFFDVLLQMRSEYDGSIPFKDLELYDKFKHKLFTEAAKKHLVSPKLALSMGIELDDAKVIQYQRRKSSDADDEDEYRQRKQHREEIISYDKHGEPIITRDEYDDEDAGVKYQSEIRERGGEYLSPSAEEGYVLKQSQSDEPLGGEFDDDDLRAATKIQAGVRGYLTRQRYHNLKRAHTDAASKIQAGIRGHLTRKHLRAEGIEVRRSRSPSPTAEHVEHELHEHVDDGHLPHSTSAALTADELAAAKIQAGIRGYLTRKHLLEKGLRQPKRRRSLEHLETPFEYDMRNRSGTNPDEQAATKIQAGIRGYLTRKRLKQSSSGGNINAAHSPSNERVDLGYEDDDDEEGVEAAATKIQAGVRSYLTRAKIKKQKEAATKIQSAFRGHHVRRELHDDDLGHHHRADDESDAHQHHDDGNLHHGTHGHDQFPHRDDDLGHYQRGVAAALEDENGWEKVPSDGED